MIFNISNTFSLLSISHIHIDFNEQLNKTKGKKQHKCKCKTQKSCPKFQKFQNQRILKPTLKQSDVIKCRIAEETHSKTLLDESAHAEVLLVL